MQFVMTNRMYRDLVAELSRMNLAELVEAAESYGFEWEIDDWGDQLIPSEVQLRNWVLWALLGDKFGEGSEH